MQRATNGAHEVYKKAAQKCMGCLKITCSLPDTAYTIMLYIPVPEYHHAHNIYSLAAAWAASPCARMHESLTPKPSTIQAKCWTDSPGVMHVALTALLSA